MRKAMADAEVGDDVFAEDPTILELQARTADLFGQQAGLLTTTGSMSNLLGIWSLVPRGQEVVCDLRAHIVRAELGAHAASHGITTRTWESTDGLIDADRLASIITPDAGPYMVSTAAVELENTHNFGGGTIYPLQTIQAIHKLCRGVGVKLHLDGARIWNAHVATGVPLAEYGKLFDTVSVCFSKGLGAPVGSMLLSDAETIARARVQRKRLGGGWRQAGILAAAARYALDHHIERLADDNAAAKVFASEVAALAPDAVDAEKVATNIVVMDSGKLSAASLVDQAAAAGVRLSAVGGNAVRAVTHLDVSHQQCVQAGRIVGELLATAG
jgi:threonine aldolase